MGKEILYPVAEYRGIAIIERPGDQRSFWRGEEYYTDGDTWLAHWSHDRKMLMLLGLPDERTAKNAIDDLHMDGSPHFAVEDFLSFEQVLRVLRCSDDDIKSLTQRTWEWDETQGVFVDKLVPLTNDGQHRHQGR